ncbi:hypothetical protein JCM8097_000390 [Rhodosporidiobolus ruineniae]
MMGLKAKTLSLPHLSLSRTSSPSRGPSQPPTPATSTPTLSGETDPTPPTSASSSPNLKPKRSNSPKDRAVDAADVKENKGPRRSSIGASFAALTSRSSTPSTSNAPSPTLPPSLVITTRSTSDERTGLRPLRTLSSIGGGGKGRSKSSDRAHDVVAASTAAAQASATAGATLAAAAQPATKEKKGGMMGAMRRGIALGSSQSQPGLSRSSSAAIPPLSLAGDGTPGAGSANGAGSPVLSGTATPAQAYAAANGAAPPSGVPAPAAAPATNGHGHGHGHGGGQAGVQLHQLAESYIGKVSLRLGEAVNKVFLPIPTGPGGIPNKEQEKMEAPYGGSAVVVKGRTAPRVAKSREVGELISTELQAALHDPYLLRTLLRSSVLKALSLFLTRLSALLLQPSPSDPALTPSLFNAPSTVKEADALPLPLRFNLQIVRCAYEVKRALAVVADPAAGFPVFVDETLRPWRLKLAELMGRVMGPLVGSARLAVSEACGRARLEGVAFAHAAGVEGVQVPTGAVPAVTTAKPTATSQLRSLSLGRGSPAGSGASTPTTTVPPTASSAAAVAATAGPSWLRDVSARLDAFARLVARLECGADADKWLVTLATAITWKGMLNCSARVIGVVGSGSASSANGAAANGYEHEKHLRAPSPVVPKKGFLGGVTVKKSPSPPASPPLPTVDLAGAATAASSATARLAVPTTSSAAAHHPTASDVAFVRLLSDLELLEARLQAFLASSVSNRAVVLAPAAAPSSACPSGPSCGLCRTGRTLDEESSDSDDEDEDDAALHRAGKRSDPGRESRLALSAMREAMQALSALIVVVRASKDVGVIQEALEVRSPPREQQGEGEKAAPLTPMALFAQADAPAPATLTASSSTTSVTLLPPSSSLSPSCPTLHSALLELPPLILLHLLASRLPPSTAFRLPHVLWALRGGWAEYASELRGFAAGEEWAQEVAWEMGAEVERVELTRHEENGGKYGPGEREVLEALKVAVRRAGGAAPVDGRR